MRATTEPLFADEPKSFFIALRTKTGAELSPLSTDTYPIFER